ncbi:MAG: OmpA family protein, partial [Fimbriimonadaceae bacterium]|nr:OmpA family protein [Fimbriimonadaceae bacterium]
ERAPRLSPSLFHATRTDAGIVYSAVLRDTTERKKLQMALADVEATGTIDVDLGVGRSAWLDSVKELVRDMPRGLELSISDNHVVLDGLPDRDMAQLVEILRDRVSGLTISLQSEEPDLGGVFAAMSHPTLEEWLDATNRITVSFQSGGTQLAKTTEATLKLATEALLRSRSKTPILIAGYTDSTGSDSGNRRLSQRRAQAVLEFMVSRGVNRDQLTAEGFGPDDPIASNLTAEGRAKNRRIEFRIKR